MPSDHDTSFILRFVGDKVRPWLVPINTLAKALSAVQRLVVEEPEDEEEIHEKSLLHLLDVTKGSACYPVYAEDKDQAIDALRQVGKAIADPDYVDTVSHILNPLEDLSAIAKQLDCELELSLPNNGEVLARIQPVTHKAIAHSAFISGDSSLEGYVERVGGATSLRCGLRVRGQANMLICRVQNFDVARQLGQHLYEHIIVDGNATWFRRSWKLHSFEIRAMRKLDDKSVSDKFDALRQAADGFFDNINDVESYISDLRGEDDCRT